MFSDAKVPPRGRGGKSGGKDKRPSGLEQEVRHFGFLDHHTNTIFSP